jgi:hypothetical protein
MTREEELAEEFVEKFGELLELYVLKFDHHISDELEGLPDDGDPKLFVKDMRESFEALLDQKLQFKMNDVLLGKDWDRP